MALVTGLAIALLIAAGAIWVGGILRGQDTRSALYQRDPATYNVSLAGQGSSGRFDAAMAWTAVDDRQFWRLADSQRPDDTT